MTILAIVHLKVTDLNRYSGGALARKPLSFTGSLDMEPHTQRQAEAVGHCQFLGLKEKPNSPTHTGAHAQMHTPTHIHTLVHTHTSLTLPAPLYLGVREAGYLKARGEYSISCLIWDISLPVLTITKGFILGGKFSSETVRLGGPIYSQRERVCVKGGKPSLTLSKRLHNLIGSPFP